MEPVAEAEPHAAGLLDVGDGHRVHWAVSGRPDGPPALVLHGGPGSGSTPGLRSLLDPTVHRVVSFDQRSCGRSTPNAAEPVIDLATNTTAHLVADCERLRVHLGVARWLVIGGSWGSTLALAYAQAHPARVEAMVLWSVVTTGRAEVDWVTRRMGRVFPEAWARFRDHVPAPERDGELAAAYARLLHDPDPGTRERAAAAWCAWEDTHVATHPGHRPDPRYRDPRFRLAFARLVTHYWANAAFLPEGQLMAGMASLASIPAVLVHGRLDVSSPPDIPWELARRWPAARLVLIDDAGHGAGHAAMAAAVRDRAGADRMP